MLFHTAEQLGPTQSLTPDGFLLCERVPIARTGTQLYAAGEVPVEPGSGGIIRIIREDSEVFRPETIASFNGKPVTLDHPPLFVTPETWKELTVGVVQNVRRGEGADNDLLIADLLITDADAIAKVRAEPDPAKPGAFIRPLREVSCGYDANYIQESPGVGYQRDIIGNHVALVERGRAGSRCSIKDSESVTMTTPADKKPGLLQKLFAKAFTLDADQLEKLTEDAEESDEEKKDKATTDAIAKLTATVDSLAATVAKLAAGKTKDADESDEDDEKKTEDADENGNPDDDEKKTEDDGEDLTEPGQAAYVGDALKDVIARAEILAPGIKVPTKDSVKRADIVALQRAALGQAMKTADSEKLVSPFLAGRKLEKMTADGINAAFIGASELVKTLNNAKATRFGTVDNRATTDRIATFAENADKLWKNK